MLYYPQKKTNHKRGTKMSLNELLLEKREDILRVAARRGAFNIRVFGSVARGKADEKSGIALLVVFKAVRSRFDLGAVLIQLQEFMTHKEDIVTERVLAKSYRERRLKDALLQ